MNKLLSSFSTVLLIFPLLQDANASVAPIATKAWLVSDAVTTDPHGLWTDGLLLGDTNAYSDEQLKRYSFNSGSKLVEYDDGSAHLTATATNPSSYQATIDMWFDNWADTYSPNKTAGGTDISDWDYYTTVRTGSNIQIDGTTYYLGMVNNGIGPKLQIGTGANDKTSAFGASTWLDIYSDVNRTVKLFDYTSDGNTKYKHWDLNMDLQQTAVPLPAAAWLFFSGLAGVFSLKRKKISV